MTDRRLNRETRAIRTALMACLPLGAAVVWLGWAGGGSPIPGIGLALAGLIAVGGGLILAAQGLVLRAPTGPSSVFDDHEDDTQFRVGRLATLVCLMIGVLGTGVGTLAAVAGPRGLSLVPPDRQVANVPDGQICRNPIVKEQRAEDGQAFDAEVALGAPAAPLPRPAPEEAKPAAKPPAWEKDAPPAEAAKGKDAAAKPDRIEAGKPAAEKGRPAPGAKAKPADPRANRPRGNVRFHRKIIRNINGQVTVEEYDGDEPPPDFEMPGFPEFPPGFGMPPEIRELMRRDPFGPIGRDPFGPPPFPRGIILPNRPDRFEATVPARGTAFAISADGYLLTCEQVVRSAREVEVIVDGKPRVAEVVRLHRDRNIALLKLAGVPLEPLPLGSADPVRPGTTTRVSGYPVAVASDELKFDTATIRDMVEVDGRQVYRLDRGLEDSCGGPVLDERGRVIGLVRTKGRGETLDGAGFAIPIGEALPLLDEFGLKPAPAAADAPRDEAERKTRAAKSIHPLRIKLPLTALRR